MVFSYLLLFFVIFMVTECYIFIKVFCFFWSDRLFNYYFILIVLVSFFFIITDVVLFICLFINIFKKNNTVTFADPVFFPQNFIESILLNNRELYNHGIQHTRYELVSWCGCNLYHSASSSSAWCAKSTTTSPIKSLAP